MEQIKRDDVKPMISRLHKGSIYSVVFIKKDGTERTLTSIKGTARGVNGKGMAYDQESRGLMSAYDMTAASRLARINGRALTEEEAKLCWRSINLNTVTQISCGKKKYTIKNETI
jgi:hypothetical protein